MIIIYFSCNLQHFLLHFLAVQKVSWRRRLRNSRWDDRVSTLEIISRFSFVPPERNWRMPACPALPCHLSRRWKIDSWHTERHTHTETIVAVWQRFSGCHDSRSVGRLFDFHFFACLRLDLISARPVKRIAKNIKHFFDWFAFSQHGATPTSGGNNGDTRFPQAEK